MTALPANLSVRTLTPRRASLHERLFAILVSCACAAVLIVAAYLQPDSAGHGTHTQLGLYPCTWVILFDKPCPTCGMTTSFAQLGDRRPLAALHTQPFGTMLALSTATMFWFGLHIALTGSTIARALTGLFGRRTIWIAVGSLLAAWAYKIVTWPGV